MISEKSLVLNLSQELSYYLTNIGKRDREIGHGDDGDYHPLFMNRSHLPRRNTNPSRSSLHLNALVTRRDERGRIEGGVAMDDGEEVAAAEAELWFCWYRGTGCELGGKAVECRAAA